MTEEQAAKLSEALSLGYTIEIDGRGYITGAVTSIDFLEEPDEDGISGWVYTDDTYDAVPLSGVELDEVKCFQRIDFLSLELEQQPEDHEFTYNPDLRYIQEFHEVPGPGKAKEPFSEFHTNTVNLDHMTPEQRANANSLIGPMGGYIPDPPAAKWHTTPDEDDADDDEDSDDAQPDNDDHRLPRHGW